MTFVYLFSTIGVVKVKIASVTQILLKKVYNFINW